jgi:hypothetical protein
LKGIIEGSKANCQFALPSRHDFHYIKGTHNDMKDSFDIYCGLAADCAAGGGGPLI